MEPTGDFICFKCKHFDPIDGCPAFPEGTPVERILEQGHDKVFSDQVGDFVFEQGPQVVEGVTFYNTYQ